MRKAWSDNVLFYGGEGLILLAGSYYIVSDQIEKHKLVTMPFAIGLLLLDLVAGVALHWALTKLTRKLITVSYLVWLPLTLLVLFSAGLIWMANSRTEAHNAALEQQRKDREQKAQIDRQAKAQEQTGELTQNLVVLQQLDQMAGKAKNSTERRAIYGMGGGIVKPSPTPVPVKEVVAAALPTQEGKAIEKPEEPWQPFEKESFFAFWHNTGVRFLGMFGLAGMAVLFAFFLSTRELEAATQRDRRRIEEARREREQWEFEQPAPSTERNYRTMTPEEWQRWHRGEEPPSKPRVTWRGGRRVDPDAPVVEPKDSKRSH